MKLILASNSPRRRDLLNNENIEYEVKTSNIDEKLDSFFSPLSTVLSLAYQKGYEVAKTERENLVLSADTIVVLGKEILGKPSDRENAKKIISKLSGKLHHVVTGFSLICIDKGIKYVGYDVSHVKFNDLSDLEIEAYLDIDEAYDKAGAYGIQGYGGNFVEYYEGDFENIIGLPVKKIITAINTLLKE